MIQPALAVVNLQHTFGDLAVLKGVSFEVKTGEVVAVTGPSGSGKSTLLHLAGGLDVPTSGEVWWAGERTDTLDTQVRATRRAGRVGLIFQHHYLLEDLTVLQNVMIPAQLAGWDDKGHALELLEQVGLGKRGNEFSQVLSGGERQRVAVARALAARPDVVLADEPTGSLDRANAMKVAQLLVDLARQHQTGVLLVTHDDRIASYADRILHLLDGQFVDNMVVS